MGREQRDIYLFISDEDNKFYQAIQKPNGDYVISSNSQPSPIKYNPSNLLKNKLEFATNKTYNSCVRSITYPLDFIKDGAAILRNFYFLGKGVEQKAYLTVIQWNGDLGIYELAYKGKFDFLTKKEDPKKETFTISLVDDSAWGVLSRNDSVEYAIDCTNRNADAVKVLFDGITLENKYTYQTVQAPILFFVDGSGNGDNLLLPFVLINQDGDSVGIISNSQISANRPQFTGDAGAGTFHVSDPHSPGYFFYTQYPVTVNIKGSITFKFNSRDNLYSTGGGIFFFTNLGNYGTSGGIIQYAYNVTPNGLWQNGLIPNKTYSYDYDFSLNLQSGESVFLCVAVATTNFDQFEITPIVSNTTVSTKTRPQAQIAYGIRAGDFLSQLSFQGTNRRYNVNSNYFKQYNKFIILSGDSLRQVPNAKIYSSFESFFKTFNAIFWMALRNIEGDLWMENFTEVYKQNSNLIDIGEAIDVDIEPAAELYYNEISVGSPAIDYRHPSGRLEFNSTNTFSLNFENVKNKLDLVTKYRLGCYDITFLLLDYQGGSSKDNSGDKAVYVVEITDEVGTAVDNIETFENVTIDNAILEPLIKSPLDNDTLYNNKPTVKGIAPPGNVVNIYVDNVLDGSVSADIDGNWSYNIVTALTPYVIGVTTGIHIIDATFGTELDPKSTITVTIDTSIVPITQITYPNNGDSLYNNSPLIKGVAVSGSTFNVLIDGFSIGSVTADNSGKWQIYSPPMLNGARTISADGDSVGITVDSNVEFPLITYIGSELDGFPVLTNLPLIKGVAKPGTIVTLWLNYISYATLGNATADAFGNWSFQVIPVNYPDPLTGITTVLAPIINGLNVISTSLVNHTVGINVQGYKLNRPNFTSITGVTDNTVFNTSFTPQRMLMARYPLFSSMLVQRPNEKIYFQKPDKNSDFSTTIGGVTIRENADIPFSSLGNPFLLLENATIKTKTYATFAKALYDFSSGGFIKAVFRGTTLYALPIGSMSMENITGDVQEWKVLLSPLTTYSSLLNLYKNGITVNLMKNSIYHSDYNTLHLVSYDFSQVSKYNTKDLYDDWFNNRNDFWALNPDYIQKLQKTEVIKDQIIVNGVSDIKLRIYDCKYAYLVDEIVYVPASPAPIPTPDVVLEATVDLSIYAENQYFFIMYVGETPVLISERIETKTKWPGTILIESSNSKNLTGVFFSTGFKTILRIEGIVKKQQPNITTFIATEENGDSELLYSISSKKRTIRFGTAYGLPDYLYLKIANALTMDNLQVEGVNYVLNPDEKIEPSDDIDGHPLYYYNVNLDFSINKKGSTTGAAVGAVTNAVILVVDATAFGLPSGTLTRIELNNE